MNKNPDALLNLADALAKDILNTPDDEILREVEEDFGKPQALAHQFGSIVDRAVLVAKFYDDPHINRVHAMMRSFLGQRALEAPEGIFDDDPIAQKILRGWLDGLKEEELVKLSGLSQRSTKVSKTKLFKVSELVRNSRPNPTRSIKRMLWPRNPSTRRMMNCSVM